MKNFKQLVKELPSKKVVFAFGRWQPPTVGHALLVSAVKHIAQKQDADHVIYASKTQDKKSNPLPVDRKVYYLKRMFPGTNFVAASSDVPTFIQAVKRLNKKYKNIVMVAGSDRVAEYQKILNKYNGKDFHFDSLEVVSAGERDPDAEGASGMSGTKMREAAKKGDFDSFKKGLPKTLTTIDAKRLMNEIREGMGMEQIREKVELPKDDIREAYHRGEIYNVGDIVECAGQVYMVEKRGSNHLLLREQSGSLVSKWLQDVEQTDKEFVLEGTLQEMKYTSTDKIKVARVIAGALGVEDTEKSSNPEMLINNGLRKVRSKPMRPEYVDVLHNMLQTAREAGIKFDEKLVPQKAKEVNEGTKQPNGTDKVGDAAAVLSERTPKLSTAEKLNRGLKRSGYDSDAAAKRIKEIQAKLDAQEKQYKAQGTLKNEELDEAAKTPAQKMDFKRMMSGAMSRKDYNAKYPKVVDPKKKIDKTGVYKNLIKTVGEEVELEEGKMGQLSADIGSHIDKHVDDYKTHGGAEHLMSKIDHTAKKIAAQHGMEHKHAHKFVSDYVEKKLHEELKEWVVKHDGVDADHPDEAVRKLFQGKKDVINHMTKYKTDAGQRANYLRKKGFKNVRIEEQLNEISTHTLDKAWHKHYQSLDKLERGSPEWHKAHKSMSHINKVSLKRTQDKLIHMAKHDPEAYKKSAVASADADAKRGWSTESYEEISDLLEQIATAAMMNKDTTELKKKLRTLRGPKQEVNTSDVEAQEEPTKAPETAVGHSLVSPLETTASRKMKVHYATEAVTTAGEMFGEKAKKSKADLDEDQATAEYKVKTYFDNARGKTVTRKIRPHRVTFAASKKNAEPEVDQPGEAIKNEEFPGTDMSVVAKKDKKVEEGIAGMPAGDMGSMPIGTPEPFAGNPAQIDPELKKKLKDKKALNLKEEDEGEEDEEHDDVSTESDLDDMANEVQDLEDIIDAYDEDELVLVDDEGEEVKDEDDKDDKEVNEEALNEVLSRMERMKAKIRFAQSKSKRERKIKIALRTPSTMKTLNSRARKLAVKIMKQRLARKPLNKLSVSEKERIEKVIQRRKKVLNRLAMKLVSKVKKIEQTRLHKGK